MNRINPKAVVAATLSNWALSVGWYSIFGRKWAELTNTPPAWKFELDKVMLGIGFNLLMALGTAVVLAQTRRHGAWHGAKWGLVLACLFVLPAHSGKWTWQDKPLLLAIDTGGHLVSLVVSGIILGAWVAKNDRNP